MTIECVYGLGALIPSSTHVNLACSLQRYTKMKLGQKLHRQVQKMFLKTRKKIIIKNILESR